MEKSIIITIMIDNVKLGDIEKLVENIEAATEEYKEKRINVSLQDTKLLSTPFIG